MFSRKTHFPLRNQDDFRGPNAQVYSPNTARSYNPPPANPMNTFSGGAMGSPDQGKFGGGAGDFRYGTQPKSPDYGAPDYGYNPNKFNTFDSKATYNDPPKPSYSGFDPPSYYDPPKAAYDPPKAAFEPPQSPKGGYGGQYDQGSNFDNTSRYEQNTMDSRYRGDNASRGYPTNDRNPSYGGGGNFKSSQL
ncbi:protein tfg-1-like [Bolinopsis microptera]|uniref:protein tfg-1-like n=1 Tax=Bolinopsis microptera TaxID=2820187 RepID=UPI00307A33F9